MDLYVTQEKTVQIDGMSLRCAIGQGGFVEAESKVEGDLKTPMGSYPLRACYYRADKIDAPPTGLPLVEIRDDMGWCDDPSHSRYNQLVRLPFDASHELMWRKDDRYDLVIDVGYNDTPIFAGKGSAIFVHLATEHYDGTHGCVALNQADLLQVLARLDASSMIHICA